MKMIVFPCLKILKTLYFRKLSCLHILVTLTLISLHFLKSKRNGGITQNAPQQSKTSNNTHKEKSDDVALDGNGKKVARSVTQEGKGQGIQNVGDPQEGNNGENNSDTNDIADDSDLNGNIRPSGTVKSGNIICHLFDTIE